MAGGAIRQKIGQNEIRISRRGDVEFPNGEGSLLGIDLQLPVVLSGESSLNTFALFNVRINRVIRRCRHLLPRHGNHPWARIHRS